MRACRLAQAPALEAGLTPALEDIDACLESETETLSVSVFITPSGQNGVVRQTTSPEEETCIEEILATLDLPDPGCQGTASFTTTLSPNIRRTQQDPMNAEGK